MAIKTKKQTSTTDYSKENHFEKAWKLMNTAKAMTELYEENREVTSKYVHATSRGHEARRIDASTSGQEK